MIWRSLRLRLALACVPLLLAVSCSSSSAILVNVTSPLAIPTDIDELRFHVVGTTTSMSIDRNFPGLTAGWPHSLSLRPGAVESSGVIVTVTGLHAGTFVVQRVVRAMFMPGVDQTIEVVLPAECRGVRCDTGVDCAGGRCVGGGDAGPSADAGDAGPHDGGGGDAFVCHCMAASDCDDHVACTVDACAACTCSHTPSDTLCATGTHCDAVAGCPPRACHADADCDDHVACNGVETCNVAATTCVAGTPPCDDANACTDDACNEAMPAATRCTHTTRDADHDMHGDATCPAVGGVPADDCNDADAATHPGATDSCNGVDDNCNAMCDETFSCCAGTTSPCTATCGTTGTRTCAAGTCTFGACVPPAETCNGVDDDCNGTCDDGTGLACCAGTSGPCMTTCMTTGTRTCDATCQWGTCTPPAEICNGIDDNCNGTTDEGFACAPGASGPCTTSCNTTGTQTCTAACALGVCAPPPEICNLIDDNCDGVIDEGCAACFACTGAISVASGGGRYRPMTVASAQTGSCGGAGSEAYLSFTLATASDVFISTHQATVDTVIYVRSCSCAGTEVACNNDADGRTTSALHLTNLAPGTYHVFVDSASAPVGTTLPVDIYITAPAMPSDRCGNPTLLPAGTTSITGNQCAPYANDIHYVLTGTTCPYGGGGQSTDRIYYFVVPTARSVTFSTCNAGTTYDTALYVRSVCSDDTATAQVACNDDGCSGSPHSCTAGLHSSLTTMLTPGLYYLVVDGYVGSGSTCPCGDYQVDITGL